MLWTIIVILFILWLLGFSLHIGGGLIHILLVLAVIVLIFNLLSGRRALYGPPITPSGPRRTHVARPPQP
jgi:hypothetical protein